MSVFVLIIVGMVVLVWSALRSPLIQTMLANQITAVLSRTLGADVSVKKARYYIRQGLTLQDVLIRCPNGDTLLYVPQLSGYLRSISANERQIGIQRAYIRGVQANIVRTDSVFNFNFLLESFNKPDTAGLSDSIPSHWQININELTMVQSRLTYADSLANHHIDNLNVDISNFNLNGDTIDMKLETLTAAHNGTPMIENLRLDFAMAGDHISVSQLNFSGRNSSASISKASLNTATKKYTAAIESLRLCPADFAQIVPQFEGNNQCITLNGQFGGTNNRLRCRQMQVAFGDSSLFNAEFTVRNISNLDSLSYKLNVNKLHTSSRELASLLNAYAHIDTTMLSGSIGPLGGIDFTGQGEGTLNNIVANGCLNTGIGNLNVSVEIDRESADAFNVSGHIASTPVALNSYIGKRASLRTDLTVNGVVGTAANTNINVNGMVNSIRYANVSIDSVAINGRFANRMFSGSISSFDSNLRFDFDGLVNISDSQSYNFKSCVYYANLSALGLVDDSLANISFNMNANFSGPGVDQADGTIEITDLYYFRDSTYLATDTVLIAATNADTGKVVTLTSEYVSATAAGDYHLSKIPQSIRCFAKSFVSASPSEPSGQHNRIGVDMVVDYPYPITAMFVPWLTIASGTNLRAEFDDSTATFRLRLESESIMAKSLDLSNVEFEMHNDGDSMAAVLTSDVLYFADYESMKNIRATGSLKNSLSNLNIKWDNLLKHDNNSGDVTVAMRFGSPDEKLSVDILPSWITILDTTATIQPASIALCDTAVAISHFDIDNGNFRVFADGVLSDNPNDSLSIDINNVRLDFVSDVFGLGTKFSGLLSCQSVLNDLRERLNGNLTINDFAIDSRRFGNISANTAWNIEERRLMVGGALSDKGGHSLTTFGGYIDPSAFEMNLDAEASHQDLQFLKLFLSGVFSELTGTFGGKMHLEGRLNAPRWYGKLGLEDAHLTVRPTKATYIVTDTLEFDNNKILFKNILGHDTESGTAQLDGQVWHRNFKEFFIDLRINADNVIGLNTRSSDSPLWYGKTYASGIINISGSNRKTVDIDISATTMPKSMFYITMEGRNDLTENDFITFVSTKNVKNINEMKKSRREQHAVEAPRSMVNLNLDLKVTPDAEVQIVFDPTIGDALRSHGSADLSIRLLENKFSIYGTYLINNGNFTFTLQNVISKKLDLQSGSYLTWTGEPLGATVNIDAAYKLRKVPVYSLTLNEEDREKRVPVNCHLLMTNKLVSPNIGFSIDVPSTITRIEEIEQLNSLPEDDLNQQVINLLLFNKFYPLTSVSDNSTGTSVATVGASTASELLSNQLSKWISQLSTNFDLGVAYRPETEISSEEYELALSTSLWNDRITVSSNFDVNNNQDNSAENSTQYTTDFSVELKLNKKGNVRLKAFQKVNEDLIYDDAPYTRGLGVFYTEDFNDFGELWRRWFRRKRTSTSTNYNTVGESTEPASMKGL